MARVAEEGGYHLERLWRGVTDHHVIEGAFLNSAEARKLHRLTEEQRAAFVETSRLVRSTAAGESIEAEVEEEPAAVPLGEEPPVIGDSQTGRPAKVDKTGKDGGTAISRPSELLEAVLAAGRKGLSVQRYKGLGEMNAEQLWETTLDPNVRSLLQVRVEDGDITDDIFTRLMGDVVEPRREFIVDNALNVANLDV